MKKKVFPVVLSGAIALSMTYPLCTYANEKIDQKIDSLQQNIEESKANQEDLQDKLNENEKKRQQEKATLAGIEADLSQTKDKIQSLNEEIAQTEGELEETKAELKKAEDRVVKRNRLLQERVRLLYVNGKISYFEVLLKSDNFRDFLARFQAVQKISERDQELLEQNRQDREQIAADKQQIEAALAKLAGLRQEVEQQRTKLAQQQQTHQSKLASLQKEHDHLDQVSEQEEQAINALIGKLAKAEEEKAAWEREQERERKEAERKEAERKKQQAESGKESGTSTPASVSGSSSGFAWPVSGYGISSYFGYRIHPISHVRKLHAGIDIAGSNIQGKPILAAADGKVTAARPSGGYGNIVVIYHGNGISTKYAHMPYSSIKVQVGQSVSKGQPIANVGSEGNSTGPHLHFEVLQGSQPVNPMKYF